MGLEGIINGLNHKVHAFNSSVDALSIFKQRLLNKCCANKFDLVLTDIQMPDLDGFQLTTHIKQFEQYVYKPMLKQCGNQSRKAETNCTVVAVTAYKQGVVKPAAEVGIV